MRSEHKLIYGIQEFLLLHWHKYKLLSGTLQIFVSEITKIQYATHQWDAGFFVLNAMNLSEENEKLSRSTHASFNYKK